MLFKWMVCQILDENRIAFSNAQQLWNSIAPASGFLFQFGGWDSKSPGSACIMGIWKDQEHYQNFMETIHDKVTEKSQQEKTYESLKVSFYHDLMRIPGNINTSKDMIDSSSWIRVAECTVKPTQIEHFTQTQVELWNPGMAQVDGMLGGYLCCDHTQENKFLVMSFWRDQSSHQNYVDNYFPELREKSNVEEDIELLLGRFIEMLPEWKVYKT